MKQHISGAHSKPARLSFPHWDVSAVRRPRTRHTFPPLVLPVEPRGAQEGGRSLSDVGLAIEAAGCLHQPGRLQWCGKKDPEGKWGKESFSVTISKMGATMDSTKLIRILSSGFVISLPVKSRQFLHSLIANPSDEAHACGLSTPNVRGSPNKAAIQAVREPWEHTDAFSLPPSPSARFPAESR